MTFSKYRQKSRPLFLSLELLNIYELNIYQIVSFMYSHCSHYHGNLPLAFRVIFTFQGMALLINIIIDLQQNYT